MEDAGVLYQEENLVPPRGSPAWKVRGLGEALLQCFQGTEDELILGAVGSVVELLKDTMIHLFRGHALLPEHAHSVGPGHHSRDLIIPFKKENSAQ